MKFSRIQLNLLERRTNDVGASLILCNYLTLQLQSKSKITTFFLKKKVLFCSCLLSHKSIATCGYTFILFIYTFSTGEAPAGLLCPFFIHSPPPAPSLWQKWRNCRGSSRQQPQLRGIDHMIYTERLVVLGLISVAKGRLGGICLKSVPVWKVVTRTMGTSWAK